MWFFKDWNVFSMLDMKRVFIFSMFTFSVTNRAIYEWKPLLKRERPQTFELLSDYRPSRLWFQLLNFLFTPLIISIFSSRKQRPRNVGIKFKELLLIFKYYLLYTECLLIIGEHVSTVYKRNSMNYFIHNLNSFTYARFICKPSKRICFYVKRYIRCLISKLSTSLYK